MASAVAVWTARRSSSARCFAGSSPQSSESASTLPAKPCPGPTYWHTWPYSSCVQRWQPCSSEGSQRDHNRSALRLQTSAQRTSPVDSYSERATSIVPGDPHISSLDSLSELASIALSSRPARSSVGTCCCATIRMPASPGQ